MCTFSALTMYPLPLVDCYIRNRVMDWCLGWCMLRNQFVLWCRLYLVQLRHTHLEADFDRQPIAIHPMRIVSCNMYVYITAETNSVALAIIVSLFVRGDEPRTDEHAATTHQFGGWMDCEANSHGN